MKTFARAAALFSLVALSAGACIDDPTALEEGEFPLSDEEIRLLGLDIYEDLLDFRDSGLGIGASRAAGVVGIPAPARAPVQYGERSTVEQDCGAVGTFSLDLELDGVVNDETDAGWARLTMTLDFDGCQPAEGDPVRDGAPYVEAVFMEVSDGTVGEIEGTLRGAVRVTSGEDSALCVIRLDVKGWERTDGSSYLSSRGSVCGEAFDEESSSPPDA